METARTGLRLAEGGGLSYPVNAPSDRTSRPVELLVGGPQLAAEGVAPPEPGNGRIVAHSGELVVEDVGVLTLVVVYI